MKRPLRDPEQDRLDHNGRMHTIIFLQVLILSSFKSLKMEVLIPKGLLIPNEKQIPSSPFLPRARTHPCLRSLVMTASWSADSMPALRNSEKCRHSIPTNGSWESSRSRRCNFFGGL